MNKPNVYKCIDKIKPQYCIQYTTDIGITDFIDKVYEVFGSYCGDFEVFMKENRFLMDFNEVVKLINFLVEKEVRFETDSNEVIYSKEYHKISIEFDIEPNSSDYLWVDYCDSTWQIVVYNNGNIEKEIEVDSVDEVIEFIGNYIVGK